MLTVPTFKTGFNSFFVQAEVSPPHYDDLNWTLPLAMSMIWPEKNV